MQDEVAVRVSSPWLPMLAALLPKKNTHRLVRSRHMADATQKKDHSCLLQQLASCGWTRERAPTALFGSLLVSLFFFAKVGMSISRFETGNGRLVMYADVGIQWLFLTAAGIISVVLEGLRRQRRSRAERR